ncbi:MAG TPA: hypothetical protein VLQ93_12190 [Myxococcaceae bacterium]|nr:hypothetical protein [Myxococcaceae bacterium]
MRGTWYGALRAVACALWASTSAAGEAPSVARVRLSLKEPARVEGAG